MRTRIVSLTMTLMLVLMIAPTTAAHAKNPCKKDTKALCKDVKPGKGRIVACLKKNYDQLSPKCQATFDAVETFVKKHHEKFQKQCGQDIGEHCADVVPGQGRQLMCLAKHEDQLEPDCKRSIQNTKKLVKRFIKTGKKFNADCREDKKAFCDGVKPGEGRIVMCLNENRDDLSESCAPHFKHLDPPESDTDAATE